MKKCSRCGFKKEETEFGSRMASHDFLMAACKACLKISDKKRDQDPARIQKKKDYSKTEAGIVAGNRAKRKWRDKNSFKRSIHVTTGNAIRDGLLVKAPCECCEEPIVHAHHDDYDKPLEVRWLCSKCHEKWHEENGEGLNAQCTSGS